jgi:hypothetical protein
MSSDNNRSIKVRNGNEVRRFAFPVTGSFATLCGLVKDVFALPEKPAALKWRDEEGDIVTLSSDLELAEALRASAVLVLILGEVEAPKAPAAKLAAKQPGGKWWRGPRGMGQDLPQDAHAPSAPVARTAPAVPSPIAATAPLAVTVPVPTTPAVPQAVTTPAPAPVSAPVPAPQAVTAPGQAPAGGWRNPQWHQWKQERQQLLTRWREEKTALKAQVKGLKDSSGQDKAALKSRIQELKAQLQEHKKEIRRFPREGITVARYVKDVTLPDGTQVAPAAQLVKTWRFRNESGKAWPEGTRLLWVGQRTDAAIQAPESTPVPCCLPGQEVEVSVPVTAPKLAGRYTAYFRLAGPHGKKFGQRVWLSIVVFDSASSDEEEKKVEVPVESYGKYGAQLKALADMGFVDVKCNVRLLNKFNGQMENVVAVLLRRHQRKLGMGKPCGATTH